MFELPVPELIVFMSVVAIYLAAALVGALALLGRGSLKHLLSPLVSLAVALEAVLLIFRAIALKAVPLTGLFESMIVLTMVFGLIYLFLSIAIQQVWFGSIMVWTVLAMIVMGGVVAGPAAEPQAVAATPWAIAHAVAMILGGASIMLAAVSAFLYLLGRRKLKQKKVMQVLGRVPNFEKLEHMNRFAVGLAFVLITIGLTSGLGLASLLGTGIATWLADPKVICCIAVWVLLGMMLALNRTLLREGRTRAYITITAFVLVLFAILGVTVFNATQHDFSVSQQSVVPTMTRVQK